MLRNVIERGKGKKKKLKQLCRTTWVDRIASYENFWELFEKVTFKIT